MDLIIKIEIDYINHTTSYGFMSSPDNTRTTISTKSLKELAQKIFDMWGDEGEIIINFELDKEPPKLFLNLQKKPLRLSGKRDVLKLIRNLNEKEQEEFIEAISDILYRKV